MKKNLKKVLSLVLALAMVFAMSTTVFADDSTCTITVNGTSGATYSAYKLLDVTVSGSNYSYTENSKYSDILSSVLSDLSVTDDVVTYLSSIKTDTAAVRTFADKVYAAILADTTPIAADYTTTNSTMKVAYGYYLIVETATSTEDNTDTYSLVILDTACSSTATVDTKESAPSLIKKVIDTNDSTGVTSGWQDSADADIGDDVQFQLTGSVSNYFASYATYYYAFHDKMDDGLTLNADTIVVTIDGKTVDSTCYTIKNNQNTDPDDNCIDNDCDFEVIFADLKTGIKDTSGSAITVSSSSSIVVTYTAELNSNAVLGNAGNLNYAKLVYNNNPYYTGSGQPDDDNTGETPWDQVVVLTYKLQVNKVIAGSTTALEGATFTLEKYDDSKSEWVEITQSATSTASVFCYVGLDDGDYRITETAAPAGYNKLTAPIYFTVSATHTVEFTAWSADYLTEFTSTSSSTATHNATTGAIEVTLTPEVSSGIVSVNVENSSGSILPTTGGIGTTIFYIVGVILVLGAGVLLVTRRRVSR